MWSGEALTSARMDLLWGSSAAEVLSQPGCPGMCSWHVPTVTQLCPGACHAWLAERAAPRRQSRAVVAGRMEQKCLIWTTSTHLSPASGDPDVRGRALSPLTLSLTHLFAFSQRFKSSGSSWSDESGFTSTTPDLAELQEHSSSSC